MPRRRVLPFRRVKGRKPTGDKLAHNANEQPASVPPGNASAAPVGDSIMRGANGLSAAQKTCDRLICPGAKLLIYQRFCAERVIE